LQHIELNSTFNVDVLAVTSANRLAAESRRFYARVVVNATERREVLDFQKVSPLDYIGEVEVDDVVACDNVRVYLLEEVAPSLKHFTFLFVAMDSTADNRRTSVQSEHVPHENLAFAVDFDNVGDLNHRVGFGSGESALVRRAFDVKTHDSKRSQL
jgi:hypothetical protein